MPHRSHRLSNALIALGTVGSVVAAALLWNAVAHYRAARREIAA